LQIISPQSLSSIQGSKQFNPPRTHCASWAKLKDLASGKWERCAGRDADASGKTACLQEFGFQIPQNGDFSREPSPEPAEKGRFARKH
jgi:hypothetical protein